MNTETPESHVSSVILHPVSSENWRAVARLKVSDTQQEYVAEPCYYLALCHYDRLWQPLAICLGEQVIGFMMWAIDKADGCCWLGGILIDQAYQRKGFGRQAIQNVIAMLGSKHGFQHFALSYAPTNPARHLYHTLGFIETGEQEDDEVVARLSLER